MQRNVTHPLGDKDYTIFDATVATETADLHAHICSPRSPSGWVLIGYSRHFRQPVLPINTFRSANLATIYLHLIPPKPSETLLESETHAQLTQQMVGATHWLHAGFNGQGKPIGLFGAYQDGSVALSAAALLGNEISAVVSFHGRPDRTLNHLSAIQVPTLLVVNEADDPVLATNVQARWWLRCHYQLSLVPGRLRLLRESSVFKQVEHLAGEWFRRHLLGRQPLKGWRGPLATAIGQETALRFN